MAIFSLNLILFLFGGKCIIINSSTLVTLDLHMN